MKSAYIKLIISAFFWGSSAIAGKILFKVSCPSQVSFLRFFLAFCFIGFFLLIKRKYFVFVSFSEHLKLAILGVVGIALCYYFYFKGLYLSSAFNAGIIESTIPLITLFISVMVGEEKFELANTIGFIIAYIGVIIIVTKMDLSIIINSNYNFGDVLLLLSTLCFGIYNVLVKKFHFKFKSQYMKLLLIFMYGSIAIFFWLIVDLQTTSMVWDFSLLEIVAILVLSLGASVLSYIFFNHGISKLGSIFVSFKRKTDCKSNNWIDNYIDRRLYQSERTTKFSNE